MAEAVADPRRREVRRGLISTALTTLAQGVQWLLLALLFSILTEWVGMVFWWPDEGLQHSRSMLEAEIIYLDSDFRRSVVTSSPAEFAKTVADKTYTVLFEFTRVVDFIAWLSLSPAPDEGGLRPRLQSLFEPIAEFVIAGMQVTQVFSVRLAILTLAMPVFALFSLVALVDGFVKRDLRRWGGGRESSFVYHWAKRSAMPLMVLSWVIYLALPFSLHPTFIVLPFATLFAFSVAVTASTFKKYL
jgi:integrating conjugative element membrane protein (TIGR03747 family)